MIETVKCSGNIPIPPRQSGFNRWFWQALSEGRFETVQCGNCQTLVFPPRPDCPNCLTRDMYWHELSGQGSLYSRTIVRAVPKRLIDTAPLPIGIIDLAENIRIVCALVETNEIQIGDKVVLVSLQYDDGFLFGAKKIN